MNTRRTKIVCTLGPASSTRETISAMIEAGMDVARLNFSHGDHESHARLITAVREAEREAGRPIAIMGDLQGPNIRIGDLKEEAVELRPGDEIVLTKDQAPGDAQRMPVTVSRLIDDVPAGATLLLDDGYITLKVLDKTDVALRCTVVDGGLLKPHKGIIAPSVPLSGPALTDKDMEDLAFAAANGMDFLALSFVQSEMDVLLLKKKLTEHGAVIPVIAKIERAQGFEDLEDIIETADGVMVARGDLGLEMPAEEVPVLQKRIIRRCNETGTPVITATQMLESMITNSRPTRAEASDVANAVLDGTDAVMLSGETSVGKYPVGAVRIMARIIETTERYPAFHQESLSRSVERNSSIADGIGNAACTLARQVEAQVVISLTSSGRTARIVSKYRPSIPIIAVTDRAETLRHLVLVWGVRPVLIPQIKDTDSTLKGVKEELVKRGFVKRGAVVVFTAGIPLHLRTTTNMLFVTTV